MAVTYKDIDLLTQKSAVAGTEKIPVSDTNYVTPDQIAVRKRVHLSSESEMPVSPDSDTLYIIDAESTRQTSIPTNGFKPNILYVLGTLTGTVNFTLASPESSAIINHYYWTFDTGSTAPSITFPASVTAWVGGSAPTISASKHYEISILEGIGAFVEI